MRRASQASLLAGRPAHADALGKPGSMTPTEGIRYRPRRGSESWKHREALKPQTARRRLRSHFRTNRRSCFKGSPDLEFFCGPGNYTEGAVVTETRSMEAKQRLKTGKCAVGLKDVGCVERIQIVHDAK
jgi:hypothetical protein